jgi:hypothetical protein
MTEEALMEPILGSMPPAEERDEDLAAHLAPRCNVEAVAKGSSDKEGLGLGGGGVWGGAITFWWRQGRAAVRAGGAAVAMHGR